MAQRKSTGLADGSLWFLNLIVSQIPMDWQEEERRLVKFGQLVALAKLGSVVLKLGFEDDCVHEELRTPLRVTFYK